MIAKILGWFGYYKHGINPNQCIEIPYRRYEGMGEPHSLVRCITQVESPIGGKKFKIQWLPSVAPWDKTTEDKYMKMVMRELRKHIKAAKEAHGEV